MKSLMIFLSCLLLSLPLWAQYQERALVSASGFQGEAAGYFVEYSLGELAIGSFEAGGLTALVGFHQPPVQPATGIPALDNPMDLTAYPNPTRAILNVRWNAGHEKAIIRLSLVDMRGITVLHFSGQELSSHPFRLSMHALHPGLYFLRAECSGGHRQVIKVSLIK